MFVPATCPGCGALGVAPCNTCVATFRTPPPMPSPPALDELHALLSYDGPAREVLAKLKYRNNRSALQWLAPRLAALVETEAVDVVTWAPTSTERRRDRGFDQAELLARAVARHLRRPAIRLLDRCPGPAQTGRTLAQRQAARPTFVARRQPPTRVLLVDDVVTSGSTMSAAAGALHVAGAPTVIGLAGGRTPLRSATHPPGATHRAEESPRPPEQGPVAARGRPRR